MKFRYEWIREFVPTDLPGAAAGERITSLGFTLDGIEPWGDDVVLDVDVTTNRPDAMNHRGLARELAASLRLPLSPAATAFREDPQAGRAADAVRVRIECPELCRRYAARVAEEISAAASPDAWADRLLSIGLRPVNHVVDATNLALHEIGHPLHAFDLDTLRGGEIVVRRARPGESLTTLDGIERPLAPEDLVIADAERPVALAGIMGGAQTEIGPRTRRILLESAHFDPATIRRTARRLGLRTDASHRFERGADPGILVTALDRVCALLQEAGPARVLAGVVDEHPRPAGAALLRLRLARLRALLGFDIPPEEALRILQALEFAAERDGEGIAVAVPSFRGDIAREVDLIEEVARHAGYDRIPSRLPPASGNPPAEDPERKGMDRIRRTLSAAGFREAVLFPFLGVGASAGGGGDPARAVRLLNPLAADESLLRGSLLPGLLAAATRNLRRGEDRVLLFETGRAFLREGGEVVQPRRLALLLTGPSRPPHWGRPAEPAGFYDLKGVIEALLRALGVPEARFAPAAAPVLHPAESATVVVGGTPVGAFGRLHPDLEAPLEARAPVYVGELELDPLLHRGARPGRARALSRFPWVDRDLNVLVPRDLPFERIREALEGLGEPLLQRVGVRDRYEGKGVPEGMVSLTLSLRFQSMERTLTQEDVAAANGAVVQCLAERLGVQLRS